MTYVLEGYWACGYTDPCSPVVPVGGAGGGKKKKPHKPGHKHGGGDFAIALPGAAEFFAAADAAEPAPASLEAPWAYPVVEVPMVDFAPTLQALERAEQAMVMSIAADMQRADMVRQQAQAKQQQISKILAIVGFVDSLSMSQGVPQ